MNNTMTGLFKCRKCGCIFEGKVDVTQAVNWAIKDITETLGGDGITSTFSRSLLPERFVLHWCEKDKVCICDLVGWKIKEENNDPHMDT